MLCIYSLLQNHYQPFIKQGINQFELILISITLIILCIERGFIEYNNISNSTQTFVQVFVSILTFSPLIIFIGLIYYYKRILVRNDNYKQGNNYDPIADVELMSDDDKSSVNLHTLDNHGSKANYQSM